MSVLDLAYDRIDKKLDELEVTDAYFRGLRAGLIDALELIDILDMELDGRLPAGDDVREHLNLPPEPEPDWLDAPAVLARHVKHAPDSRPSLWVNLGDGLWGHVDTTKRAEVWDLRDVTPLYPKEGQDA